MVKTEDYGKYNLGVDSLQYIGLIPSSGEKTLASELS